MANIGRMASDICLTQLIIVTSDFQQLNSSHQHGGSGRMGLGVEPRQILAGWPVTPV
jgi:hypothetical protein